MTIRDDDLLELLAPELEEELGSALRAAWAPDALDPALNEALIAQALEDPLAAPSEEELVESERLRRALDGDGSHPSADLARALAAAAAPRPLSSPAAERLAQQALGRSAGRGKSNVIYVVFGSVAAVAALAASVLLFVKAGTAVDSGSVARAARDLAQSRSTAPLFHEKFDATTTTARIDRIALARARDLRSNRYALWGVR
jgi:hypothetical protein